MRKTAFPPEGKSKNRESSISPGGKTKKLRKQRFPPWGKSKNRESSVSPRRDGLFYNLINLKLWKLNNFTNSCSKTWSIISLHCACCNSATRRKWRNSRRCWACFSPFCFVGGCRYGWFCRWIYICVFAQSIFRSTVLISYS